MRPLLGKAMIAGSVAFLAYCWCVASIGAFKILTHTGHAKRAPMHFCEISR